MSENLLKLNSDKTEIIIIGSDAARKKFNLSSFDFAGSKVDISNVSVKNLGVIFDSGLTMKDQIAKTVKTATYHLRNISRVRKYLTIDSTKKAIVTLILSRIDYCNSLYAGLPSSTLKPLQMVQNYAARIVFNKSKFDHVTPLFSDLHWLPIQHRISFKIILIVYKCLNDIAPNYLRELLQLYTPQRTLRSSDKNLLKVPRMKRVSFGDRAFCHLAPVLWNSVPSSIRNIKTIELFRKQLKAHLFRIAF